MSEPNERASDKTESNSEVKHSDNQSDTTLLEDEEMPTYTSLSSPLRREDADNDNIQQRQQCDRTPVEDDHSSNLSDDPEGSSVYVVSSGDETDHQAYDDEDENEYDDMDDLPDERRKVMLHDEDEMDEEDEDDDPIRLHDVDTEEEYEVDSERASDDFVLRQSRPLGNCYKPRSLSLQDLTTCKNNSHAPYSRKRYSLDMTEKNYMDYAQDCMVYPTAYRKPPIPSQYRHVESKVKQYIMNIREQNRRFMEKRSQEREYLKSRNHLENNDKEYVLGTPASNEELKPSTASSATKDYVMKVIKELENEENDIGVTTIDGVDHIQQNGKNDGQKVSPTQQVSNQRDSPMDVQYEIRNEKNTAHRNESFERRNGSMEGSLQKQMSGMPTEKDSRSPNINDFHALNGYDQQGKNLTARTITYKEYMYSYPNSSHNMGHINAHLAQEMDDAEKINDADVLDVGESDSNGPILSLKVEDVRSVQMENDKPMECVENSSFTRVNDQLNEIAKKNMEIASLKMQLEKNSQFNTLRETYQKVLAENLRMKQELEDMKKSLAKYEKENQPRETKVAEVQTETIIEPVLNQDVPKVVENVVNKLSLKTAKIESTSSLEQWTDSPCSVAMSFNTPEVTAFSDSDSSFIGANRGTPRRTARPLSKAFITSSRILQTLSNITNGKSKPESPLVRGSGKILHGDSTGDQEKDDENSADFASPAQGQSSNSKKRKATDMLGTSTFSQPFKIPHTSSDWRKKLNVANSEARNNLSKDCADKNSHQQSTPSISNCANNMNSSTSAEENQDQSEDTNDQEENVKCFVYREDEHSKDRSFLIQAEESTKDVPPNKSRIRECGPYLLGNVEVRMSEVNGTINIWGKEVSEESTIEEDNDDESNKKSPNTPQCDYWQKPCNGKFNGSQIVCSTGKKQKLLPRFDSKIPDCPNSPVLNGMKVPFSTNEMNGVQAADRAEFTVPCGMCGSAKALKDIRSCSGPSGSRGKPHSCHVHQLETPERQCKCVHKREKQKQDNGCSCIKEKSHSGSHRRFSLRSPIESIRRTYRNNAVAAEIADETSCKHHKTCRRSFSAYEDACQHVSKCNSFKNTSHSCEQSAAQSSSFHGSNNCCNRNLSDKDEEDPLISMENNETPETRQRRLRGKRVRGLLMDLLRGCGDCHNTSIPNTTESLREKAAPCRRSCPPQIKISPCSPPSCAAQSEQNDRCCCEYAVTIESQLTEFRQEMERLRSRSDAILDMLNMLQSPDIN